MDIIEWLKYYNEIISIILTLSLVLITGFYVIFTKRILNATVNQLKLSFNPVIGINIINMNISEVYGTGRRNLNIELELINVGNAPAIEILPDGELLLEYSNIDGEKIIPARFEPRKIPFIRTDDKLKEDLKTSLSFGNICITHLFDDFRESDRLNKLRIETSPSSEPYFSTKLKIIVYYRNNIGQYFESIYEIYLNLGSSGVVIIPKDNETVELMAINHPNSYFQVKPIQQVDMIKEIAKRNKKRDIGGW